MTVGNMARQLEWKMLGAPDALRGQQVQDPLAIAAGHLRDLQHGVEILFGRVMDAIPYVGTYKVLPERGLAVITCCHMTPGGSGVIGTRGASSIPCGSHVWFIYHRDVNYGVIIGVEPYFMTRATLALSDYIYIGSRSGLHRDPASGFPWRMNSRGIGDWSAGAPFDSTTAGEWCQMSRTGVRAFVDDFMAHISAGEACGVYAFLWDQLCRVAGINLQIRSNCFEWEALDDQSEHYDVVGSSIYPWEALGASLQGMTTSRAYGAKDTQIDKPWYGAIEPALDAQMPVRRRVQYGGYLGQGGKLVVQVPTPTGDLWQFGEPPDITTVFEEHVTLAGGYSLRSAKSVIIAKRPLMPSLAQQERPESLEGDTDKNYKASGAYGNGAPHQITGNISLPAVEGQSVEAPLIRHAGNPDLMAYVFNWETVHPFYYHQLDWQAGEESASNIGSSIPVPQFGSLGGHDSMYMNDPPTSNLNVDHRYNSVQYALTNSYFALLEDGGIAIGDGFGSEIRMTGGHIHLTAPGDVYAKGGRNVVSWGGRDVLIRANRHAEVSSTTKDVRIKAERHLWCLAGNSGNEGLLLLESRSNVQQFEFQDDSGDPMIGEQASAGGIALRAPQSNIVNWGQDIYLRTGGGSVQDGMIVLDASKGQNNIITNSNTIVNFLQPSATSGLYLAYYDPVDPDYDDVVVSYVHSFEANFVLIDCNTAVLGWLAVDGAYYGNDWIYLYQGHIITALADEFDDLVLQMDQLGLDSGAQFFAKLEQDEQQLCSTLQQFYTDGLTTFWYQQYEAGNTEVMTIAEFSFRTAKQCGTLSDGTLSFRLFEDHWQQLARLGGNGGTVWSENWVTTQGTQTAPYPGAEAMQDGRGYVQLELNIFDDAAGASNPRKVGGGLNPCYADPTYGEPILLPLDGNYTINP